VLIADLSCSPRRSQFTPALQAVRRFQDRGIVYLEPQPTDILVLKGYAMKDGPLPLVFLDLAHTSTRAKAEASIRQWERTRPVLPSGAVPNMPQHWRQSDESWVVALIGVHVGFDAREAWDVMEADRGLLGLWQNTWWKN